MNKNIAILMVILMAVGFNWSFPKGLVVAKQTKPKGLTVSFMTSVATLNYQGQKVQNRVQTVSLAKIERQISSSRAAYALSGQGGLRIGKEGKGAFYGVSPIMVNRDLSNDRLSSDKKGLGPFLNIINGTLNGLTHKHMASEAWEEIITLSLGEAFPETLPVRFSVRPLPEPDSKWILITADSGLISFRALDKKYQDSFIYGQYRGILVYSPKEDAFLQTAAAFILYHGEDKFRIEQLHFAADANGNQLHPVLNVGPYLDFKPEAPAIATQGAFPSWCIQAAHFLDVLHLAIMTVAEGSTNPGPISNVNQLLLNTINHDYNFIEKMVGKLAADEFLGDWMKVLNFYNTGREDGAVKAIYEMVKDLSKDLILAGLKVLPFGIGNIYKIVDLNLTALEASIDQMDYDVNKLMRAPFSQTKSEATLNQGEIENPKVIGKAGRRLPTYKKRSLLPLVLVAGLVVGGILLFGKKLTQGGGSDKYDGTYNYSLTNVHGMNTQCSGCVTISGGRIDNSEHSFKNAIFASNGNLSFSGPCPNGNNAQGNYVGQLIQGNPSYKWSGHWTCADGSNGGANSIWTIWR